MAPLKWEHSKCISHASCPKNNVRTCCSDEVLPWVEPFCFQVSLYSAQVCWEWGEENSVSCAVHCCELGWLLCRHCWTAVPGIKYHKWCWPVVLGETPSIKWDMACEGCLFLQLLQQIRKEELVRCFGKTQNHCVTNLFWCYRKLF